MNFRQNAVLFCVVLSKNLYSEDIMQHVRLPELSVHNHGISSPVICEPMQLELSANTHTRRLRWISSTIKLKCAKVETARAHTHTHVQPLQ